jgi:hypothetical protein
MNSLQQSQHVRASRLDSRVFWIALVIAISANVAIAQNNPLTKPSIVADVRLLDKSNSTELVSHGSG